MTVVADQHKALDSIAKMLTSHTAKGAVSMTPEHGVFAHGELVALAPFAPNTADLRGAPRPTRCAPVSASLRCCAAAHTPSRHQRRTERRSCIGRCDPRHILVRLCKNVAVWRSLSAAAARRGCIRLRCLSCCGA